MGFAANSVGGANGQGGTRNVPQISVTGQSLGLTSSWGPGQYGSHNYNWRDVLSWVRGAHTLKFGTQGTHAAEYGNFSPVNNRPSFQFNNLLDLAEDQPYSESFGAINPVALAICCAMVLPEPRMMLSLTPELAAGPDGVILLKSSQRRESVKERFGLAFQSSSTKSPKGVSCPSNRTWPAWPVIGFPRADNTETRRPAWS
ncbi:MAG TPA: hypothetical protein VMR62_20690 [Bryobacteraceae bacterium]|jgi:hypothetical protein|nr:hypothetical protein [Bryobacteraceae bacterium]